MKILAIAAGYGLSRPISGGQNRFMNLLKGLKKEGNEIFLLESEINLDQDDYKIGKVFTYQDYKLFNRHLVIFRDFNFYFIWRVYQILKSEDIELIQTSHPSGVSVIKVLTRLMHKEIPLVYDAHNVESNFSRETFRNDSRYSLLERSIIPLYISFLESMTCKFFVDFITSVSDEESNTFLQKYKNLKPHNVSVIPSGSEVSGKNHKPSKERAKLALGIDPNTIIIFFHGLYTHFPNKESFEIISNFIAPKFEKTNKNILFVLGGNKAPKFKKANVISVGFIEDLNLWLSAVDIAIVPLIHGAGTKLKIFDYMNAGLPIVSTKKGIEGIEVENFKDAIIVNDVNEEFISQIQYLITNKIERERIGSNAQILIEEKYNWKNICAKLNSLLEKIKMEYSYENRKPLPNE